MSELATGIAIVIACFLVALAVSLTLSIGMAQVLEWLDKRGKDEE